MNVIATIKGLFAKSELGQPVPAVENAAKVNHQRGVVPSGGPTKSTGLYLGGQPFEDERPPAPTAEDLKALTPITLKPAPPDALSKVPATSPLTFDCLNRLTDCRIPRALRDKFLELDADYMETDRAILEVTPSKARAAFLAQGENLHLKNASEIANSKHRSLEEIQVEKAARMKSLKLRQKDLAAKVAQPAAPIAEEIASKYEAFADKVQAQQQALYESLGLNYVADFATLSIRKAAADLRARFKQDLRALGTRPKVLLSGILDLRVADESQKTN